ncbi:MAG: carbohydrate ABC transporter substrate-binding protein [Chloroflexi bacterium]|nr:carbohydrate ABC transporter substrate-binding protein [Chloroflexota bacterium]
MKRHSLPLVSLLLALLLVIGACGGADEEAAINVTPVAITYMTFNQATEAQTEELVIQRFQEKYPAIQVTRTPYNQQPQNYLLGSADPPDVMFLWTGYLLDAAMRQNLLGNLTDVWQENGFTDAISEPIQAMSYYQGAPYFVPGGHGWTAIYYNREIFQRYGLTPPTTWQEFLNICEILLANGETPLSIAGNSAFVGTLWFDYLNMRLNGPEFHRRLLDGEEEYTGPEIGLVFETLAELLARGYFVESPATMGDLDSMLALVRADTTAPIVRRKAVMALGSNFTVGELPGPFLDELDFFPFPVMDPNLPVGEVGITFGFVVPANAPHPAQANTFAGFMGSTESAQVLTQQTTSQLTWVPVHRDFDRSLYTERIRRAEELVGKAEYFGPPMILSLPNAMGNALDQALTRLLNGRGEVADWQLLLEDARQRAIQNGEYPQP